MFHIIITTAYIIPNIYVFLRINRLFINKAYKLHFAIVYLLLALIYPLGNYLFEGSPGIIPKIFLLTGSYLLPFYLYLFLGVLLFDLLLGFNFLFKFVPRVKLQSARYKSTALSLLIILSLGVVAGGIINFNTIRISEYKIEVPAKASKIRNLRIAFAADFHLEEETNIHFVRKFGDKIRTIQPDIMIFGGDLVEGDREGENMIALEAVLSEIKTKYGVFTVPGNHEHYAGQEKGSFFDNSGICILSDSVILIDSSFYLAGRNDSHSRTRKLPGELLKTVTDSFPLILADHRPSGIEDVRTPNVDIQLSGHTHNGQLFPINLIIRKIYDLGWGYKKLNNTHFFVTSGIRLWGPPVRTVGKSEIMVIDIVFIPGN